MQSPRRVEILLPLAVGLCLLLSTVIISPHRPMWLDEVYSYYSFAHDSFGALVRSYATGVNTMPPLYFFAVWPVFEVVPLTPLTLRLVSSLGCAVAVFLIWKILRGHVGFFAASVAALTAFLTSELFLFHNSEARYYGIYLALVAWTVYNYDRLCTEASPTAGRLVTNAVSHALAVSCTYVAGLYSFALLLSLVARDRAFRVWRPRVYLSVVLGWIPVLVFLPMVWEQRTRGGWMKPPGISVLYEVVHPGYHIYFVLCALAGLLALALLRRSVAVEERAGERFATDRVLHLIVLSFALLAVPYVMWLLSWVMRPLLLDRYGLPSLIGVALLLGVAAAAMFPRLSSPAPGRYTRGLEQSLRALLLAALLTYPLVRAISAARPLPGAEAQSLPRAEPQAIEATSDPHSYYPRYYESGESRRIYYVMRDEARARTLERFNARLNPITLDELLAKHERFRIVSEDAEREWIEEELKSRGGFRITTELRSGKRKVLVVERMPASR